MKKIISIILVLFCLISLFGFSVTADDGLENIPSDTYTYWLGYSEKKLVSSKAIFEFYDIINANSLNSESLPEIKDIYLRNDILYVLTDEIILLDSNNAITGKISQLKDSNGKIVSISGVSLYVDKNGLIYLADKDNGRIIIFNNIGKITHILELPESSMIPTDFTYCPTKIAVDSNGFIYVLSQGCYYGALVYNPDGSFNGFFGANTVKSSILDVFSRISDLYFTTDEQKAGKVQKLPYQFSDLCIDSNDYLYTCTGVISKWSSQKGQINVIGPSGNNILNIKNDGTFESAKNFNFADEGLAEDGGLYRVQDFCSLDVDEDQFIYALDQAYGKVFVYDTQCNLLGVFGGGIGEGTLNGTFVQSTVIAANGKRVYVLDSKENSITVFSQTEYGKAVMEADSYSINGDYAAAAPIWKKILHEDRNSQLAYRNLAKYHLLNGDYREAMGYAKIGLDKKVYSQAFSYIRNDWLKANAGWIFLIAFILISGLTVLICYYRKNRKKIHINERLRLTFQTLIHPFDGFNAIKYKNGGSVLIATMLLVLYFITQTVKQMASGFIHSTFDRTSYNVLYTLLGTVGVVVLWVVCNWGMSVLFSGKCKLNELYIVTCYATLPLIVSNCITAICSHFILQTEAGILSGIAIIAMIITGILLCIGTMIVSEFDFFKFVGTGVISVVAMGVVIFLIFMIVILLQQFFGFFVTIFTEIVYR